MTNTTPTTDRPSLHPSCAVLWASAFVIMALIIVQAGRPGAGGNAAYAGDVGEVGHLRLITSLSSQDEEILSILDQDNEIISAYGVANGQTIELYDVVSLPAVFSRAAGNRRR